MPIGHIHPQNKLLSSYFNVFEVPCSTTWYIKYEFTQLEVIYRSTDSDDSDDSVQGDSVKGSMIQMIHDSGIV